jgi:hypothetical protein
MPNDPKFVRLANRLALQMVADVTGGSGWSIAGLDVKEFPEDEEQAAYVRVQLGRGVLEVATQAEYDEVHDEEEAAEVVAQYSDPSKPRPWQEAEVQAVHAKKRRSLEANRESDEDELSEDEEDEQRRQAIADEQEELGLNTDDPEEQVSRVRSGGVRAKKVQAAKKSARRQRAEASESSE